MRTILGVDEASGSLTLAGDIDPQGLLRLMHASTDALVDGAEMAAEAARAMMKSPGPGLALLVSCVGRKIVMGDRVEEEIEAVAEVFGPGTVVTGFYSNGEISPLGGLLECKLHNQTMTITHIAER
jgi:small ligand-binding sensory domain FIST